MVDITSSENTSGQRERAVVPPEVRRWNWGAFLLNWIWGIGNDTYIALLMFVPLVNFVMPFVLGAKGSEWAWRNKRWRDVAHFRSVQRTWAVVGLVVVLGAIALVGLFIVPFVYFFGHSEAYRTAVAQLQASPVAISELGTPITTGFPTGSIKITNDTGSAQLAFSASGPKAEGTVYVIETLQGGHWVIRRLQLEIKGRDRRIDLVPGRGVDGAPVPRQPVTAVTLPMLKAVWTVALPNDRP